MGSMKSGKSMGLVKGGGNFCGYLFVPQRGPKDYYNL